MINKICDICSAYVNDTWVLLLSDHKFTKFEISGHLACINEIETKIKSIKNVDKLTVDKVLKEINFQKQLV
jgi:hypothetical protein